VESKRKIYIISGLGADERVFQKLTFPGFSVCHIEWITPFKNESLEGYAKRLSESIMEQNPVIVGLSFGGMVASEIVSNKENARLIVLASAKSKYEVPWYYRLAGKFGLDRIVPSSLLRNSGKITEWLFGVSTKEDRMLLHNILADTDPVFLKWAIHAIVKWKRKQPVQHDLHIHGTADRILPARNVKSNVLIPGGGHFMTITHAQEINRILKAVLPGLI
jgi:pimeloyl-ACP methyl ester carboxylesterase